MICKQHINACNCLECLDADSEIKTKSFKAKERKLLSLTKDELSCRAVRKYRAEKITIAN